MLRITSQKIRLTFTSLLTLALLACGGGDNGIEDLSKALADTVANLPAKYRIWEGNSNKDLIQDGNLDFYLVEDSSGSVVHQKSKMQLTGMTVNNGGAVFQNSRQLGSVILVPSTTAGKIALFSCVSNSQMKITIDTPNKKYTINCWIKPLSR